MAKTENMKKRVPKNPVKMNIQLNEEQKKAKAGVYNKDVSVILGPAASGKTQFAVNTALDLFTSKKINRVIISRQIMPNKLGFIPGDIEEKMAPQIAPIKDCMYQAMGKEFIDKLFAEGSIEILPIDFMKGITYTNACVIIDEAQDLTEEEFELTLTRLGKGSKLIYTGSLEQVDSKIKKYSCSTWLRRLEIHDLVNFHTFTANHRNDVIFKILNSLKQ